VNQTYLSVRLLLVIFNISHSRRRCQQITSGIGDLALPNEAIICKETLFGLSVRKNHLAVTVLNSLHPLTLISAAINPLHFAKTIPFIILVLARVDIT
jgi:hypothetical protein